MMMMMMMMMMMVVLVVVVVVMMTHRWEHRENRHMRAHESRHIRAHIWEHTYESRHMRAHIWKHRYESTQRKAHRRKHTYENTEESIHMSLRSRNAHGQVTRAILCGNWQEKCRTRSPQEAFRVEIYRKSAGPRSRARHFVRAYAVETHMDISEESFYAVINRKNAGPVCRARPEHLDWTPGLLLWPYGHIVWGKIYRNEHLRNMKSSGNQPQPTMSLVTTKPIHLPSLHQGTHRRRVDLCPVQSGVHHGAPKATRQASPRATYVWAQWEIWWGSNGIYPLVMSK